MAMILVFVFITRNRPVPQLRLVESALLDIRVQILKLRSILRHPGIETAVRHHDDLWFILVAGR